MSVFFGPRRRIVFLCSAFALAIFHESARAQPLREDGDATSPLKLWYSAPATQWMEALPLGNGRIGLMVRGQPHHEIISLNEITCWSGKPSTENVNPDGPRLISEARQMVFDGQWKKLRETMPRILGQNRKSFGTNLELGNLILDFEHDAKASRQYYRDLDISSGVASVSYENSNASQSGGSSPAVFKREMLVSNPDNVIVVQLTGSKPGSVSFFARLDGGDKPFEVRSEGDATLLLDGDAFETMHSDGRTGVRFHGRLKIVTKGGRVTAQKGRLSVEGADSATLLLALGTSFGGNDPTVECRRQIEHAALKDYAALKQAHVTDHRRLFSRVSIDLGKSPHPSWPTDKRMDAVRKGESDPALTGLLFQYARYLLIAASRENSPLPMHGQGVWNDNRATRMAWGCHYTLDINVEMFYWPAEVGNLPECHVPLMNWISGILRPSGRHTAKVMYGARGWTADVMGSAWGYSAPGWGGYSPFVTGGTWVASHLWSHYLHTGDRKFLAEQAYPTLKENAEFHVDMLVRHPRYGWYVSGPSSSPENSFLAPDGEPTPWSMAPTVDVALIRQLFASCITASEILNVDGEFRKKLIEIRDNLPPFQIGKNGQLQEWLEDYDEPTPGHRHTSHLLAVYPYGLINPDDTPDLAKAARVTVERRINDANWQAMGWSLSMTAIQLARLREAEGAFTQLRKLMERCVYGNLLDVAWRVNEEHYPIFQIDGNGGAFTAISEMLLQSYNGRILLLPALPKAWPSGHVKGLCAQGGFELDLQWDKSRLVSGELRSKSGGDCTLWSTDPLVVMHESVPVETKMKNGLVSFATVKGRSYQVTTRGMN